MEFTLAERVETILAPIAEREGFELVAVETAGGHRTPIIRVFLDRTDGIDIDAIVSANHWIGEALDAADPIPSAYTLEVSSPGIDRPLRKLSDFERFAGKKAVLKTTPIEGRAKYTGTISGVDHETVVLDTEGQTVRIPFGAITKAHLKDDVEFNTEGSGEPR